MADAIGTITYKEDKSLADKCGHGYKLITGQIAWNGGTYVTNGMPLDLSLQLPTDVHLVLFEARGGYVYEYDYTNKKVKIYYYDYNNAADGAAIELLNSVAISMTVRFVAIGK